MKQVKLLYHHPNKNNRALGTAKVLNRRDHKGEEFFHEPEVLGKKTVYTVPEDYARRLLAGQPDRYFLLEPKSLMVRFKSADGLSTQYKEVKSILGSAKMKELEELIAKEAAVEAPAEPSTGAKAVGTGGLSAIAGLAAVGVGGTGTSAIHSAPDNPTSPAVTKGGPADGQTPPGNGDL